MSKSRLFECNVVGNIIFGYPPTLPLPHSQAVNQFLHNSTKAWRRKGFHQQKNSKLFTVQKRGE